MTIVTCHHYTFYYYRFIHRLRNRKWEKNSQSIVLLTSLKLGYRNWYEIISGSEVGNWGMAECIRVDTQWQKEKEKTDLQCTLQAINHWEVELWSRVTKWLLSTPCLECINIFFKICYTDILSKNARDMSKHFPSNSWPCCSFWVHYDVNF